MEHPSREQWMAYLYKELDREAEDRMQAHLQECRKCRSEVASWREVMAELDGWRVPTGTRHPAGRPRLARWAAAAMLLIALGYGIGWFAYGGAGPEGERQALEMSIRKQLRDRLSAELQASVADARARIEEELHTELGREMRETSADAVAVSGQLTSQLLREFLVYLDERRTADNRLTLNRLRSLELQQASDYAHLRADMDTLAGFTRDGLAHTNENLIRFIAYSRVMPELSGFPNSSNVQEEGETQ